MNQGTGWNSASGTDHPNPSSDEESLVFPPNPSPRESSFNNEDPMEQQQLPPITSAPNEMAFYGSTAGPRTNPSGAYDFGEPSAMNEGIFDRPVSRAGEFHQEFNRHHHPFPPQHQPAYNMPFPAVPSQDHHGYPPFNPQYAHLDHCNNHYFPVYSYGQQRESHPVAAAGNPAAGNYDYGRRPAPTRDYSQSSKRIRANESDQAPPVATFSFSDKKLPPDLRMEAENQNSENNDKTCDGATLPESEMKMPARPPSRDSRMTPSPIPPPPEPRASFSMPAERQGPHPVAPVATLPLRSMPRPLQVQGNFMNGNFPMNNNFNRRNAHSAPPRQKATRKPPAVSVETVDPGPRYIPENYPRRLALPKDAEKLNKLHCFIREELLEVHVVPASTPAGPLDGHVCLRCVYCAAERKKLGRIDPAETTMAIFYPKAAADIYRMVTSWQRCHVQKCNNIPTELRQKWEYYRNSEKTRGKTAYWTEAAIKLGIVNITGKVGGIRFKSPDE